MLGARPSPMLDILLRDAKSAGLAAWLPFCNGLTGDMADFGVGGKGLRAVETGLCVCCSGAGMRGPSGLGEGLLKRASNALF